MQRLINEIVERAKANRQRIVLPEGTEERAPSLSYSFDGGRKMDFVGLWARLRAYAGS